VGTDPDDFSRELVPLALAARMIGARLYADEPAWDPQRLTGIAHVMAALAPLYTRSADGASFRRLTQEELLSGNFRKGGAGLHFKDGRSPIGRIAVMRGSIEEVVRLLKPAREGEARERSEAPRVSAREPL
jgi:hypothetical protein